MLRIDDEIEKKLNLAKGGASFNKLCKFENGWKAQKVKRSNGLHIWRAIVHAADEGEVEEEVVEVGGVGEGKGEEGAEGFVGVVGIVGDIGEVKGGGGGEVGAVGEAEVGEIGEEVEGSGASEQETVLLCTRPAQLSLLVLVPFPDLIRTTLLVLALSKSLCIGKGTNKVGKIEAFGYTGCM